MKDTGILIIGDSFKGTLSSAQFGKAVSEGLNAILPDADILSFPMADGGEGSLQSYIHDKDAELINCQVTGPYSSQVSACYAMYGKTAFIESSIASGFTAVRKTEDIMRSTSYGTGELIKMAVQSGSTTIYVGLGGSLTSDCGAGLLQALGVSYDLPSPVVTGLIGNIEYMDISRLNDYSKVNIKILSDVNNPLPGDNGAFYTYSPQKGASLQQIDILEKNARHFADLLEKKLGRKLRNIPGAGAAGGMGFALMCLPNAKILSGSEFFLDLHNIEERIKKADVVITGEGSFDFQSSMGKLTGKIIDICRIHKKKCILLCGRVTHTSNESDENINAISLYDIYGHKSMTDPVECIKAFFRNLSPDSVLTK